MNAAARQRGFSFVEIMVAVVLLAICAVPMGEAIRNGLMASRIGMEKARELRCMRNTMEAILAEPYQTLWDVADAAARNKPATYILPADASCDGIARTLSITMTEQSGNTPVLLNSGSGATRREPALLNISLTSDKGYPFTTLVAR